MNDFDRFLDLQLRRMLDPVVATPAPPRGSRPPKRRRPILVLEDPIERVADAMSVGEPVVVTVPVASSQL
jgi:hypothetical protein